MTTEFKSCTQIFYCLCMLPSTVSLSLPTVSLLLSLSAPDWAGLSPGPAYIALDAVKCLFCWYCCLLIMKNMSMLHLEALKTRRC